MASASHTNRKFAVGLLAVAGLAVAVAARREVLFRTTGPNPNDNPRGTAVGDLEPSGRMWQAQTTFAASAAQRWSSFAAFSSSGGGPLPPFRARGRGLFDVALWSYALVITVGAVRLLRARPSSQLADEAMSRAALELPESKELREKELQEWKESQARFETELNPGGKVWDPMELVGTPPRLEGTPGQCFGRYQLLTRLGEGGMAEVFTAVAYGVAGFSRVFVLKRLRRELCHDEEAVGQFIDEARMQANLVHGNIVPAFDLGRVGDEYFMTQEYIVGRDLARLTASCFELHRRALSPRVSYYVVLETLQALQYAHTRSDKDGQPLGIVHRDVSVGNIIVSAQGEVKLADFGIVQSNRRGTKTLAGTVKGNANFMSPEQARGQLVDLRSDIFSAGLVLYYCLMNRVPYAGDNDFEVLFKAASGPTAEFIESMHQLPPPAREVLGRALALDPADRFQSASEFADALAPHVAGAKLEAAHLMQSLFGEALKREAA